MYTDAYLLSELVALGSGWLHRPVGTIHMRSRKVSLTGIEHALMSHLADRSPDAVSKEELLERVWGYRSGVRSHTLKTTVSRLRRKLGSDAECIRTISGKGYALVGSPERPAPSGDVTLVMLTASMGSLESGSDASAAVLDDLLDRCADPRAFAFFDAPFHLGLAFSDPNRAVAWALGLQRAAPTTVRVAIGMAASTNAQPPHYAGPGRERASTLAADAHWKQISVDGAVRLSPEAEAGLTAWTASVPHIYRGTTAVPAPPQAAAPVAVAAPPPIAIVDTTSSWVGRALDCERLEKLFTDGAKLITLTGPGGIGKTRLATWYAAKLDDVVQVRVASANHEEIAAAIARALGVVVSLPDAPNPDESILRALNLRGPLVLLDDAERGIGAVRYLMSRWLSHCGDARFLVTSRSRLDVSGEWVHQLAGLSKTDAGQLFCQRATAIAGYDVRLNEEVSALVDQLDGLPLAIELAAAQVPTRGTKGVLRSMEHRFEVLRDPLREDRHAALDAVIRESWDRLGAVEQQAFAWCSTFEGRFTSTAASVVLSALDRPPATLLPGLIRASLLQPVRKSTEHLVLLESLRAFARDRLSDSGEEDRARDAHAAWALSLTQPGAPDLDRSRWIEALAAEERNIHSAVHHIAERRPERAGEVLEALEALEHLFDLRGRHPGFESVVRIVVDVTSRLSPHLHARSLRLRGGVAMLNSRFAHARADLGDAVTLAMSVGDERTEVRARHALAWVEHGWGSTRHSESLRALLPRIEALGDRLFHAHTLLQLVSPAVVEEPGAAEALLERAAEIHVEIGGRDLQLRLLLTRCRLAYLRFDFPSAVAASGPARRLALKLGRNFRAAFAESVAGLALAEMGDLAGAAQRLEVAMAEAAALGEAEPTWDLALARVRLVMDEFDAAEAGCLGALEPLHGEVTAADRGTATWILGQIEELRGQPALAVAHYRTSVEVFSMGGFPREHERTVLYLVGALADLGRTAEAQSLLDELEADAPGRHPCYPFWVGCAKARLGDVDGASVEQNAGLVGGVSTWVPMVLLRRAREGSDGAP